jgi:hypothetical protein
MEQGYYLTQIADHTGRLHNKYGLPGELQSACAPTRRTLEHEHTHRGSRDDGLACGLHPPGRDVGLRSRATQSLSLADTVAFQ